mmetsp:Transcript_3948/g.7867  ORF Transcript_3948/g.7867 Transcript_3948/m.7867 type:complete len:534 (+) Transcript_3948:72-1673(+)
MSTSSDDKDPKAIEPKVDSEHFLTEEEDSPVGCGILGRNPVLGVMGFAAVGIGLGIGLSYWEPDDMETKDKLLKWIGLLGDLFIRSLKCVVLPLVFVNVILSVCDMMNLGKASAVGYKTIGLYLLTTIAACLLGILSTLIMKGQYEQKVFSESGPSFVSFACNTDGAYLAEDAEGNIMCTSDYGSEDNIHFIMDDISGAFVKTSGGARNDISLSDTVYDGVFTKLITDNIVSAFDSANFAGIIVFAIVFGVGLSGVLHKMHGHGKDKSVVIKFLEEVDGVLLQMINWIIMATPFAVFSLIVKAVGGQENLADTFENVGYLVIATILAMIFHYFFTYIGCYMFFTRTNPFTFLRHLIPAQTMAFACASSAATIPMTLKCVKATGIVPDAVGRFVVPLGATVNMDGGAIYFPCASIWLAVLNGLDVNASHYILLVIISTIGSVGTAPVPSASLVLIITAYNTVFNTSGTPDGFEFILAIDWFMDRLRTTLNVTGDAVVCGMVSHLTNTEDHDNVPDLEGTTGVDVPPKELEGDEA